MGGTTMNMSRHDREGTMKQDPFRARMEVQCSRIERYRQELAKKRGRPVSKDEAAQQWIEQYAEAFARDNDANRNGTDLINSK